MSVFLLGRASIPYVMSLFTVYIGNGWQEPSYLSHLQWLAFKLLISYHYFAITFSFVALKSVLVGWILTLFSESEEVAEVPEGLKVVLKQECTPYGHDDLCDRAIVFSIQLAA